MNEQMTPIITGPRNGEQATFFFQVVPVPLLPPLFDLLREVFFVVGDGESGCVVTGRHDVSARDRSVILMSYMIAYLLLREHKEVDPLFSSLLSSSRLSQGLQSQHSSTIHVRSSLLWVLATASSWMSSPSSRASTLDPSAHRVEQPFLPFDNTLMILRSTSDLNTAACFACLPHLIPKLSGNYCFK